jgi:peptidoglycan/LPS O-acetylase OafA/YrhL
MWIFELQATTTPPLMVNALSIIAICVSVLAIAVAVWFFIETKGLPWPKKKKPPSNP